ncbi:hypothetical protein [Luminiphilus sp. nBUS_07]|uniref:hypothetical protein n=1 Tax=Luminiphilus sp. nBUS_07 TaxID=3395314 RepID=UPI003EBE0E84
MLAKLTYKSSAAALVKSAQINFGASGNEQAEMQRLFQDPQTFQIVNHIRKSQNPAGNRNMFAAIAEVLLGAAERAKPSLSNQRFFTILFTAAAFEAGMISDALQQNARAVHEQMFPDNVGDFDQAFPLMD